MCYKVYLDRVDNIIERLQQERLLQVYDTICNLSFGNFSKNHFLLCDFLQLANFNEILGRKIEQISISPTP